MTIRQAKALNNLPDNNYSISKSMRLAGYTEETSKNGVEIARLRKLAIKQGIMPEKQDIINNFIECRTLSKKSRDYANYNRANEALARCQGMFTDNIRADINDTRSDDILRKHRLSDIL